MVSTEPGQGSELHLTFKKKKKKACCLCLTDSLNPFLCAVLHFLSFFSLQDGPDCGRAAEGAQAGPAARLHQGRSCRQARKQECLSVSRLQDKPEGTHVRVDLQPEDQREPSQVDFGWSGSAAADLTGNQALSHRGRLTE